MNTLQLLGAALSVAALGGCAAPIDRPATIRKIAVDLQLNAAELSELSRCTVATATPGDKLAVFVPCLYVSTPGGALLVLDDPAKPTYETLSRIDATTVKAVAYKEMGMAKQIQLHGATDFVVFSLLSDNKAWAANKESRAAFDRLLSLGIPPTSPTTMVMNYQPIKVQARTY
jgi:hypothetical protein